MKYIYLVTTVSPDPFAFGSLEVVMNKQIRHYQAFNEIIEKRGQPDDVVISFQLLRAEPETEKEAVCETCGLACETARFVKFDGCPVCGCTSWIYGEETPTMGVEGD